MCQLFGFSTFLLATSEKAGKSRQVNLELADDLGFVYIAIPVDDDKDRALPPAITRFDNIKPPF